MRTLRFRGPNANIQLLWDCPWADHSPDPFFILRNAAAPQLIGQRCEKCGCLYYTLLPASDAVIETPAVVIEPGPQPAGMAE